MADQDVDELESELSKKQRLINAWIAVGPEGKTTVVSELTDSSRGYASDVRRALEGEGEEEIDHEEIQDAHHPNIVEKYRSTLDEEAIDGQWEFVDRLQRRPPHEREPSAPSSTDQPPAETAASGTQEQPQASQGGGQPQPGGKPQPGRSPPGGGQPSRAPTRAPQQQPTAGTQTAQQTTEAATASGTTPGAAQQQAPGGQAMQSQQRTRTIQQVANQLRELDNSLTAQQQQAQAEINSAPPQSVTQSIAISKYNLIVEVRQSVQQLLTTVSSGR